MKRVLGEFDFFWEINFANGDVTICKTDVVAQPEFSFGDIEIIRWTFSDFFIEQTVTTTAQKLNFSGFAPKSTETFRVFLRHQFCRWCRQVFCIFSSKKLVTLKPV